MLSVVQLDCFETRQRMHDEEVQAALRSTARLVIVEAPAGCGKTFQGAEYAREAATKIGDARVLTLTHTNAACDVFRQRAKGAKGKIDVRTIDSLIVEIATAYHRSLGLPSDPGTWARGKKGRYTELATKVAKLLHASPMVARALAIRYPVVICDEHQDADPGQHGVALSLRNAGARIRVFGDPMQRIYGAKKTSEFEADKLRWNSLREAADLCCELETPWRWFNGSRTLGTWILAARAALQNGGKIDLRGNLPAGLSVIFAENKSRKPRGYSLSGDEARAVYAVTGRPRSLLVLASQNHTVDCLRAFFNRSIPIWEGHVRDSLSSLIDSIEMHKGDPGNVARATIHFLQQIATGFSASDYADLLLDEILEGCVAKRSKKPAVLQDLGRLILKDPNHKGVARFLKKLTELIKVEQSFKGIKIDYIRELWDAIRLEHFDDANEGFAVIVRRRSSSKVSPPDRAISTIHKAKGLECSHVVVMACDVNHFGDTPMGRCCLYVAMSRATHSLTLVVSREKPTPLFRL
jgi:hypothetical protein